MTLPSRVDRARRLLAGIEKNHAPAVFASRFGAGDMVVLDLITRDGLAIDIVSVDTGRLPRRTQALVAHLRKHYGLDIRTFQPWPDSVDAFLAEHGNDALDGDALPQAWTILMGEPLRRALAGKRGWVVGDYLAEPHEPASESEFDPIHGLWKFAPLAGWSADEVVAYLRAHGVPHDPVDPGSSLAPAARAVESRLLENA